jgi:TonB family protein
MGLLAFLRQWQGGRLAGAGALSVLLHALLVAVLLWGPPPFPKMSVKRGEPLIVELPQAPDSPPAGLPGRPAPPAPAPRATPPPKVAAAPPRPPAPPAPRAPAAPPRPTVAATPPAPTPAPETRAPEPVPEQRVASAPLPKAPDGETPPVAAPKAPEPAAPPKSAEPAPPAPQKSAEPAAAAPPAPPQVASLPPGRSARPVPDIRSLRPGSGGAGGSGQGRAGIEGEPIPLDSTDPRYSDYLDQVRRRIKDKWGYPCVKNDTTRECEYKTAQLIVEFGIAKNGKVPFINVVRSSGYPIYDDYAVNAVKLADFPPIPDSFSKTGVPILATFSYVVQSSLTNILR